MGDDIITAADTPALVAKAYGEHEQARQEMNRAERRAAEARQGLLQALRVHFRGHRQMTTGRMVIRREGEHVLIELLTRPNGDDFLCQPIPD